MQKILPSVCLFLMSALMLLGCDTSPKQMSLSGETMGTYYLIKYIEQDNLPPASKIQSQVDLLLEQVNQQMSTYRKDSELSQFNQQKTDAPYPVSQALTKVVNEAIRLHHLSQGALDITLGPIVNLWGFGPEGRPDIVPTDEQIAKRRSMTGMNYLAVQDNQLIKKHPDLYIDLSAIAKGYGVDAVADYLNELGLNNYLVDIGGELKLKGKNANQQWWRIAIEKPTNQQQSVQEIITPKNMAVATSGDYRNYFEQDGIRYSHTIDPHSAKPINHKLVSVTVLDKSCMSADGLATAFMVMGQHKALALANQNNIPAFFIVKTENGFEEIASKDFARYAQDI